MNIKNSIIQRYATSIVEAANYINNSAFSFTDSSDENTAIIKTLNVLIDSLRSQTVLLQNEIDNYSAGEM